MIIVKILFNEDGEKENDTKWHLSEFFGDSPRTFCGGECYGDGEGSAIYETKETIRGGITC